MTQTGMTIDAILAEEAAQLAAFEATQQYKGYTIADLRQVFDALCDPEDWKGPIAVTMRGEAVLAASTAIEFFTATTARVTLNPQTMRYLVEADGYRQGPAGDH